jgi:hypothetical protein
VLVTLVVTSAFGSGSSPATVKATLTPATPFPEAQLKDRITRVVVRQLGLGYPNDKVPRLINVHLRPLAPQNAAPNQTTDRLIHYHSVDITFHLVDHPLGRSWRLRAAQGDVFKVLRALYTNSLGVYDVKMVGVFPLQEGKTVKVANALIVRMGHKTAETIPWKRWGRESEGRLWSILTYRYLDPRFA